MRSYPGNKSPVSLYPQIIGIMPVHLVYWELFAGSAQIARKKVPSKMQILVEIDPVVINNYLAGMVVVNSCAIAILSDLKHLSKDHLVYADPPYIIESRLSHKRLYQAELSVCDHIVFLAKLRKLKCNVILSHYDHPLYNRMLHDWNKIVCKVSYHGSIVNEAIYTNYDPARWQLHSTIFSGRSKAKRQERKRKVLRWLSNFSKLSSDQQQDIMAAIAVEYNSRRS